MNEIQVKNQNQMQLSTTFTKTQEMLIPIAENYIKLCPESVSENFNPKKAIISLSLKLAETKDKAGRSAIDICTKESIMQVAQEIMVKGLDLTKNQGALIIRDNKLMLQPQYQGNVKRTLSLYPNLEKFNFVPIYKDDKISLFVDKDGRYAIKEHSTSFANISNDKIIGGYVNAVNKDGTIFATEIMTMEQIKIAWSKSSNSSLSVHKTFPLKMVRKTILNSLCTWLINITGDKESEELDLDTSNALNEENQIEEVIVSDSQEFAEISDADFVCENNTTEILEQAEEVVESEEEWSAEEIAEMNEMSAEYLVQNEENETEKTVPYKEWKDVYMPTNKWYSIKESYDNTTKTITIRKKND